MSANQREFTAVSANQARATRVFTFAAKVQDILEICEISRAGRSGSGELFGFQRPQIAAHIQEIRDYIGREDAVLPNAIVVGFFQRDVAIKPLGDNTFRLSVSIARGKPGFIVDGQQRITAISHSDRKDFEVFVSCVLCRDEEELRRQFILINNTRPLPKALIYELLPQVSELPKRLNARAFAAELTERLNYSPESSLHGLIYMHTNPTGVIKDTAIQKVIMYSADAGAIRDYPKASGRKDFSFELISNFYGAVSDVFPSEWKGHTPRTSRLVHGAGVVSMGFVMEALYSRTGNSERRVFVRKLKPIVPKTAWASGQWKFQDGSVVKWDEIENTHRQIQRLALHLVGLVRNSPARDQKRSRGRS